MKNFNKVLVSGLILSILLTSTTAFAADTSDLDDWFNMSFEELADKTMQEAKEQADRQAQDKVNSNKTTQATTAPMATSFADVKQGDWYYSTVTNMASKGLFSGYDDGNFHPNDSMTKAQFLTVVCRILGYDITTNGDNWWQGAYNAAIDNGLVDGSEMSANQMNDSVKRQEMALVAVRALEKLNESTAAQYAENVKNAIPDYANIGGHYKDFVCAAYEKGILCGVDSKGTFDPQGTLNRASAATVLNRIIDSSSREKKDFSKVTSRPNQGKFDGTSESSEAIEIIEGKVEKRRFAREGDTVIKADGSRVVLKKGPHGILGEGQGVAPDLGIHIDGGGNTTVVASNMNDGRVFSGGTNYADSTGNRVNNQPYYLNQITQEAHWGSEWQAITSRPTEKGTFHMQLSEDKNWIWNDNTHEWIEVCVQGMTETVINKILEANGLN